MPRRLDARAQSSTISTPSHMRRATTCPRELQKASLPAYRVEPPDVLLIEVAHNVRSPYDTNQDGRRPHRSGRPSGGERHPIGPKYGEPRGHRLDRLSPHQRLLPGAGGRHGRLGTDLRLGQGRRTGPRRRHGKCSPSICGRRSGIADVKASVSYADVSGRQVIAGEHLVRPDGQISLGIYGNLRVAGMTLDQIADVVTAQFAELPERARGAGRRARATTARSSTS